MGQGDVVATWKVPLSDGIHKVEFQHGTASGKRVIIIDDKVSWNLAGLWFKLVQTLPRV